MENQNTQNQDELSLRLLKQDLFRYKWEFFRFDIWAALSVALIAFPQALAYSIVVGLPPICGLLASIFGTAIAALLGSSKNLVVGPNNTTILLVQVTLTSILFKFFPDVDGEARVQILLQLMVLLLCMVGLFQILAALFRLGSVIQFVSFPVVIGYVLGASLALIGGQLFTFLGIEALKDEVSLFEKLKVLILNIGKVHPPTAGVGVLSFATYVTLRKLKLKAPSSLLMLFIVTMLVYLFQLQDIDLPNKDGMRALQLIGDQGKLDYLFSTFQTPIFDLRMINALLPMAFAIALISMLETTALAKNAAATSGHRVGVNQEILGLGASNFFLSFFGALPVSGSISRTLVNCAHKSKTRFAALFSACLVLVFARFLGDFIQYIPLSALAALIIATAMRAVDLKQLKLCVRSTRSDAFVFFMTLFSCIFFSLHIAFYIGVGASIIFYLRRASSPRVWEYFYDEETEELRPALESEADLRRRIRVVNIEGELFFGAVDLFQSTMKAIAEDDESMRVLIIRLKHVRDFDATAAMALRNLCDYLKKSERQLLVASIPPSVWKVLKKARLLSYIGKENLFPIGDERAHVSLDKALVRARELLVD